MTADERPAYRRRLGAQTMARLRACMLVCALSEAMCTKWRIRNSRVLQKGQHGAEVTQRSHGAGVGLGPGSWERRPLAEGEPGLWEVGAGGGGLHTCSSAQAVLEAPPES